jgi:hypothetical protein
MHPVYPRTECDVDGTDFAKFAVWRNGGEATDLGGEFPQIDRDVQSRLKKLFDILTERA